MYYLFPGLVESASRGLCNKYGIRGAVRIALAELLNRASSRPAGRTNWILTKKGLAQVAGCLHCDCNPQDRAHFADQVREAAATAAAADWVDVERATRQVIGSASEKLSELRKYAGVHHDTGVIPSENMDGFPILISDDEVCLLRNLLLSAIPSA